MKEADRTLSHSSAQSFMMGEISLHISIVTNACLHQSKS